MKLFITLLFVCVSFPFLAQLSINTGNTQLDADLNSINVSANANIKVFNSELSVQYNVSEKKIEALRINTKMQPAEVFLTLEISKITNRSLDEVVKIYETNKAEGWGVIAKKMGIKPGSAEFHELKAATKSKKEKGSKGKSSPKGNPGNSGKGNSGKKK